MVFKRLSTKLTVMYGGLFSLALLVIAAACYLAVLSYARNSVQRELQASSSVFSRIWTLKSEALTTGAGLLSQDAAFRQSLASGDAAAADAAFRNLQSRLKADAGWIVDAAGGVVATDAASLSDEAAQAVTGAEAALRIGVRAIGGDPYHVVATPVMSADSHLGWVVLASRLDDGEMRRLQNLSPLRLRASILTETPGGLWREPKSQAHDYKSDSLNFFIDESLEGREARLVERGEGAVIAFATVLPNLDNGQRSVLLLSYPLAEALKSYQSLLSVLFGIGGVGLAAVIAASLYLARSLTRPIMTLKTAARDLRDGRSRHVEIRSADEMADLAHAFNDMAVSIEDRERDITRLAKTDLATGMPNRSAFEDQLAEVRDHGDGSEDHGIAIIAIGIDRYAHIRAVWGGNYAHTLVSRLQGILARLFEKAFIARLSADTLGLCLAPCDAEQALPLARAIAARLIKRIKVTDDQSLDVMISQGVYHVSHIRPTADEMIERALIALDQARAAKSGIAQFDPRVYSELADTLLLTDQLYAALQTGALTVHYQPKYSYREGRIVGAEALVRWNHPERGFVSPQRFVAIAEETGAIRDLTLHVLNTVLEDQRRLKAAGHELDISINYSGRLLSDEGFNAKTVALVDTACGHICLEITETAVIEDPKIGLAAINTFVEHGIEISLDDFGTGLSSLSYLKQMPAQELKIDRSFIMEIESGQRDALLVRSTIDLAHGLGMKVTAEGVETSTSFTLLQAMGCDIAQGYGIARPMPFDALVPFLENFGKSADARAHMPGFRPRRLGS